MHDVPPHGLKSCLSKGLQAQLRGGGQGWAPRLKPGWAAWRRTGGYLGKHRNLAAVHVPKAALVDAYLQPVAAEGHLRSAGRSNTSACVRVCSFQGSQNGEVTALEIAGAVVS